jgi:hypothetical protein
MTGLSGRDRRMLTIGAVIIGATLGMGRGIPRWRRHVDEVQDRAWKAALRLERFEEAIAGSDTTARELATAKAQLESIDAARLPGSDAASVGAALMTVVSDAAVEAGFRVNAVQSTSDSAGRSFVRAGVRANIEGDVLSLAELLDALENDSTLMRVRSLAIDQPLPGAASDHPEALRMELIVDGIGRRNPKRR